MVIPCGFKSHSSHQQADVAELADALDSGSSGFTAVQVQVLSSAPSRHTRKERTKLPCVCLFLCKNSLIGHFFH